MDARKSLASTKTLESIQVEPMSSQRKTTISKAASNTYMSPIHHLKKRGSTTEAAASQEVLYRSSTFMGNGQNGM